MFKDTLSFIQQCYPNLDHIPLHAPVLGETEKQALLAMLDSGFVSSVGQSVIDFELALCQYTGIRHAVALVNGTAALQLSLLMAGVQIGDEVITQPLSFIATANAISHCGATPVFIDISKESLGLSAVALEHWLQNNTKQTSRGLINTATGRRIAACVPMHTFGLPAQMPELMAICQHYRLALVEDAAESLGSWIGDKHSGSFGLCAAMSFNGNKIITAGGGGALLTNDDVLAKKARHLSTTAKIRHAWRSEHDTAAFNWRMPNINAALACAQMSRLSQILKDKRSLANKYKEYFDGSSNCHNMQFVDQPNYSKSNFWLNAVRCESYKQRESFLSLAHTSNVSCRPPWQLLNRSIPYKYSQSGPLPVAEKEVDILLNIPSSAGWG